MIDKSSVVVAAREFAVSGELQSVTPYGRGHIHDTWCAAFDDGRRISRLILQRINTVIFTNPVAVMQNIQRVTAHLKFKFEGRPDADRRVLELVPSLAGASWHIDAEGRYWRAYRFIEGATTIDEVRDVRQAFQAARAFGQYQRQLADLPAPRLQESIPGFHDTLRRFMSFEQCVAANTSGRGRSAQSEIAFAVTRKSLAMTLTDAGLPERVTHNDTKVNNVLLDNVTGEGICVVDLDTVMPGLAAYDFGDMVRTMTCSAAEDERDLSRVAVDIELFEAVLRGYLEGAGDFLTRPERISLIEGAKVIIFEQGIRFLADYLAGDTYYKVSRPDQNLDRCRTQFKLLESIEQNEAEMTRLLLAMA